MTADQTVRDAEDPDVAALFARLPEAAARYELAARFLPLAEHLARRFGGRGQQHDDLVQVASLGLVHAIDRFDADRGVRFTTFATATIVGELKRYFRDRGWGVRVPRSVQTSNATTKSSASPLVARCENSMIVATPGSRGSTSPLQNGQWLPQPAPEPLART